MPGDLILQGLIALLGLLSQPLFPEPPASATAPTTPPAVVVSTSASRPAARDLPRIPEAAYQYQRALTAQAHAVFGTDAPVAALAAQAHQESAWRADARSRVGALGLTQFMPATAADMARRYPRELGAADPLNPAWAIAAQALYMRDLNAAQKPMFGLELSECATWWFGFRAYNGGGGWINRERRLTLANTQNPDDPAAVARWNAGRSKANHRENTEYPVRILLRLAPAYDAAAWGRSIDCRGVQP